MTPVLCQWQSIDAVGGTFDVLPDGCRDLIYITTRSHAPKWIISDLQDQTLSSKAKPNTSHFGIRFKPGAIFSETALLQYAGRSGHFDDLDVARINEFVRIDPNIAEALDALANAHGSVLAAQKHLRVSARTLQRLVQRGTGRTPSFWAQLARARASALQVNSHNRLAEIAHEYGFADQAHMTRTYQHLFGTSPAALRHNPDMLAQLQAAGYG